MFPPAHPVVFEVYGMLYGVCLLVMMLVLYCNDVSAVGTLLSWLLVPNHAYNMLWALLRGETVPTLTANLTTGSNRTGSKGPAMCNTHGPDLRKTRYVLSTEHSPTALGSILKVNPTSNSNVYPDKPLAATGDQWLLRHKSRQYRSMSPLLRKWVWTLGIRRRPWQRTKWTSYLKV